MEKFPSRLDTTSKLAPFFRHIDTHGLFPIIGHMDGASGDDHYRCSRTILPCPSGVAGLRLIGFSRRNEPDPESDWITHFLSLFPGALFYFACGIDLSIFFTMRHAQSRRESRTKKDVIKATAPFSRNITGRSAVICAALPAKHRLMYPAAKKDSLCDST